MQQCVCLQIHWSGKILHAVLVYRGCEWQRDVNTMPRLRVALRTEGKILTIFSPKMIKVRECVSMHQGAHAVFNEIRYIRAALH